MTCRFFAQLKLEGHWLYLDTGGRQILKGSQLLCKANTGGGRYRTPSSSIMPLAQIGQLLLGLSGAVLLKRHNSYTMTSKDVVKGPNESFLRECVTRTSRGLALSRFLSKIYKHRVRLRAEYRLGMAAP